MDYDQRQAAMEHVLELRRRSMARVLRTGARSVLEASRSARGRAVVAGVAGLVVAMSLWIGVHGNADAALLPHASAAAIAASHG